MKKMLLIGLGGAVGYVLGARAGRPAYDRMLDGWEGLTRRTGLDSLATTAKEAAVDVRDAAADRVSDTVSRKADDAATKIENMASDSGSRGEQALYPLATGP
jgi:hypothetical protein